MVESGFWLLSILGKAIVIVIVIVIIYYLSTTQETFSGFSTLTSDNVDKGNIPTIYYINLDKAKERNERFIKNNSHLKSVRIDAISPATYTKFDIIRPPQCDSNTLLEMCCSMSHLKAMHTAYHNCKNSDDIVLIMEDDMYFLKNPNWKELIKSAPEDWDILQLYTINTNIYKIKTANWVKFQSDMFSCGAYLMNKRSLEKMIKKYIPEYLDPNWENIKTIDFTPSTSVCASDFFIYQNMKTYVHTKILLNTEGFDSYIHPDHLPGHRVSINEINRMNNNN